MRLKDGIRITNELELANTFHNYFINIVKNLGINLALNAFRKFPESERVKLATELFEQHPSITSIKK